MMGRAAVYARPFCLIAAWDALIAVSTRALADTNWVAVPLAVALTAFWLVGVKWAVYADWRGRAAILTGAAAGTALGIVI